jgi:hypothetical protein
MKKGLEHLATTIAAGFRAMKVEFRGHRVALGQLKEVVVAYDSRVQEQQAAQGQRMANLEQELAQLKRKSLT